MRTLLLCTTLLVVGVGCWGCGQSDASRSTPAPDVSGEGATFPKPLYEVWVQKYALATGHRVFYRGTGSSHGMDALAAGDVDFAGSEAPLSDGDLERMGEVLHIPMSVGPVVIGYNSKGVPDGLRITPDVLAAIFLGEIKSWDDPRIATLNPGATLPPWPITVIHRSEGSGTTNVFTRYLSKVSPAWQQRVGSGTRVDWPTGVSAVGNEGVSEFLYNAPGTIGYCALSFARAKRLKMAAIANDAGIFTLPSLESTTAAAASAAQHMPDDLRLGLVEGRSDDSYPITGFTYILVRRDQEDLAKAEALAEFIRWGLRSGQSYGPFLGYARLPAEVIEKAEGRLNGVRVAGKPLPTTTATR
jgi:phosphate transport system substrate-binding protein